jgi:CHAD domain-containing protein
MPAKRPAAASPATPATDVLKHLGDSLETQCRRYRKRLKRCQNRFSEKAVHESRVETRRLLATVELLGAFIPEKEIEQARAALKHHLDTFDEVRDTHVQLVYVERMVKTFPAARAFREWLLKREERFTRQARKAIRGIKTKRLERRLEKFGEEIRRQRKRTRPESAFRTAQLAMDRAFGRVAQLCRRVQAEDTETIHRTRIAFKRFRYMVEAMSPLVPAVTEHHRHAMRGYQSMMGDIQDVEVLLGALDRFMRKKKITDSAAKELREELRRRRAQLIRVYLGAAGRLRQFWPPGHIATRPPATEDEPS